MVAKIAGIKNYNLNSEASIIFDIFTTFDHILKYYCGKYIFNSKHVKKQNYVISFLFTVRY